MHHQKTDRSNWALALALLLGLGLAWALTSLVQAQNTAAATSGAATAIGSEDDEPAAPQSHDASATRGDDGRTPAAGQSRATAVQAVAQAAGTAGTALPAMPEAAAGAFRVTATDPLTNEVAVPLTHTISLTYSEPVSATTVHTGTLVAQGMMGGLLTGTYSIDGAHVTLTPSRPLFPNEIVRTSTTSATGNLSGTGADPYQWQFTAGTVRDRPAVTFRQQSTALPEVSWPSVAWGDYDQDGDVDILLAGYTGSASVMEVWRNDGGGSFTAAITNTLTAAASGNVAWGDYDNDGDLDILLGGYYSFARVTEVWRNDGPTSGWAFSQETNAVLTGAGYGPLAWGDYDNDGDLDILIGGYGSGGGGTDLWRNDGGGNFSHQSTLPTNTEWGTAEWGDYDNDRDLDILLCGGDGEANTWTQVWRNDGGNSFSAAITDTLTGVQEGSAAWGDYDNDGNLDILLTGNTGLGDVTEVWRNNGDGSFSAAITNTITAVSYSTVEWGDYDNDGDLDILLAGAYWDGGSRYVAEVWRNEGPGSGWTFSLQSTAPTGVSRGDVAWGDYDNDGDLDFLLAGEYYDGGWVRVTELWRNDDDLTVFATDPQPNEVAVPLTHTISLTYSQAISAATVHTGSIVAQGMMGGLLTGTYTVSGTNVILTPSRPLFPNEIVRTSATSHTQSLHGLGFDPYQWQFTAGEVADRCVGGFSQQSTAPTGISWGSVAWGDYDQDGDLDILLAGYQDLFLARVTEVWRNDGGGSFTAAITNTLTAVGSSSVAWGDYDNDGDLDILLTGWTGIERVTEVWRNEGPSSGWSFSLQPTALTGVAYGSAAWGDYDNDGDLDILLTGESASGYATEVWRNEGPTSGWTFSQQTTAPTGAIWGSVAWGDYDNDGDLDILVAGGGQAETILTEVWRNDGGGSFSPETNAVLTPVADGSAAWGDYDNDGDLDILLAGSSSSGYVTEVWRNEGPTSGWAFSLQSTAPSAVFWSEATWGDYDNDGDLDILLAGLSSGGRVTEVWRNEGPTSGWAFGAAMTNPLTGVQSGGVAWGDYDNDGDLDILLAGDTGSGYVTEVWRNDDCLTVTATDPTANEVAVPLTHTISLTYSHVVSATTVHTGTLVAQGMMGGLLTGTYSVDGAHVTLTPSRPLFPNEVVRTSATRGTQNPSGLGTAPYQWQFTAGEVAERSAVAFRQQSSAPTAVGDSSVAWGDYDQDGDLDILLAGYYIDGVIYFVTEVWRNEGGGSFTAAITNTLTGVFRGSVAWGDYDNDGDLDILLAGYSGSGYTTEVWRNEGPTSGWAFSQQSTAPTGVEYASLAWGDYDNDGDLDILLAGKYYDTSWHHVTEVWRNDGGGSFSAAVTTTLTGVSVSSVAWGDYDNDGDLDILLAGSTSSGAGTEVWRNEGPTSGWAFSAAIINTLTDIASASVAWGDYDNDGDLDILLAGYTGSEAVTEVWRNEGPTSGWAFSQQSTAPTGVTNGTVAWGDYDNDGDLDILLAGNSGSIEVTEVWRNEGNGSFTAAITDTLTGVSGSSVAWGDYDNDGDLDILLAGNTASGYVTEVWRNDDYLAVTTTDPWANEVAVPLSHTISLTYSEAVSATTVNTGTIVVQGMMGGLLTGTYSVDGAEVTLTPSRPLFPNEIVRTSATSGTQNLRGAWAEPYQWQFTAGEVADRCVAGFSQVSTALTGVGGASVAWGDYDQDGDLDILLSGYTGSTAVTEVWRNDGRGSFAAAITDTLTAGTGGSAAWGDYDNDGDLDILLAGTSTEVWRNEGPTSGWAFSHQSSTPTGVSWGSVAWGDYDNDGDLDILLAGRRPSFQRGTEVWRNDGGSGFSPAVTDTLTDVDNGSVAWGDYDNDGDLDILLAGRQQDYGLPETGVWRNDGGGSFTRKVGLTSVENSSVAWGDYDNDGDLDILLAGFDYFAHPPQVTQVWRNDGGGSFSRESTVLAGVEAGSVAWGDYDNDGDLDILLAGRRDDNLPVTQVWRNDGGGSFTPQVGLTGVKAASVAWGDYDNDGDLDILLAGQKNSNEVVTEVWRNDDCLLVTATDPLANEVAVPLAQTISLTYSEAVSVTTVHTGTIVAQGMMGGLLSGAYSVDGPSVTLTPSRALFPNEIVRTTATRGTQNLSGIGARPYQWQFSAAAAPAPAIMTAHPISPTFGGGDSRALALGDLDGDGDLDAVVVNDGVQTQTTWLNDGGGGFSAHPSTPGFGLGFSSDVALGDLDGDGDLDAVVANSGAETTWLNDGSGGLSAHPSTPSFGGGNSRALALGDLDGDGDLDAVVADWNQPQTTWLNDGGGSFAAHPSRPSFGGGNSTAVALGDLDGDGDLDAVVANELQEAQTTWLNDGNGGFSAHPSTPAFGAGNSRDVALGDLDGDGNLDAVVANSGAQTAWLNDGGGGFSPHPVGGTFGAWNSTAVALGDLDGDGDLDAVVANALEGAQSTYLNDGTGVFGAHPTSDAFGNGNSTDVALGDLDGDGDLDTVVANEDNQAQTTWLNAQGFVLGTGWNGLALRLQPLPSAEEALDDIAGQGGDVPLVRRLLPGTDTWEDHIKDDPSGDFDLELGAGYAFWANGLVLWERQGVPPAGPVPVQISPTWTFIGLPNLPCSMQAQDLLQDIADQGGACIDVHRWDNLTSGWVGYAGDMLGDGFDLTNSEAYLVQCTVELTYVPGDGGICARAAEVQAPPAKAPILVAQEQPTIADILVTNLRDVAFSVTWRTDRPSTGWVEYREGTSGPWVVAGEDGAAASMAHHVWATRLQPETTYYFRVHSGEEVDDNEGALYPVTTRAMTPPDMPFLAYGPVQAPEGAAAVGAVVRSWLVDGQGERAEPQSAVVDGYGYWSLNLPLQDCAASQLELSFHGPTGDQTSLRLPACDVRPAPVTALPGAAALSVDLAGAGSGTVAATGINCFQGAGADCFETYPEGMALTLSALADAGSTFTAWSGACSGSGDCVVTMTGSIAVTATFALQEPGYKVYLPLITRTSP